MTIKSANFAVGLYFGGMDDNGYILRLKDH